VSSGKQIKVEMFIRADGLINFSNLVKTPHRILRLKTVVIGPDVDQQGHRRQEALRDPAGPPV
jgi:hypothetical protein